MHGERGDNLSNGSKIIENDPLVDAHYVIRFNRVMVQDKLWVLMPKVERKNRILIMAKLVLRKKLSRIGIRMFR